MLASSVAWVQGSETSRNRIAQEVGHELLTLPYYEVFDYLTYRVDGGTVTLLGEVNRAGLKTAAEKAVKQVEGVRSVVDQVEVLPETPQDTRLRLAVYAATYGEPVLNQYALRAVPPVHIVVKNGNVVLEGNVDAAMDKAQFFTQASAVPGIVSVTDHLKIAP